MRIVSCTRAEAERQLADLAEGWMHLGHEDLAAEAVAALMMLEMSRPRAVTAGHTEFRIQEAQAS